MWLRTKQALNLAHSGRENMKVSPDMGVAKINTDVSLLFELL
jgi:hypothetical protein